jgi:methylenetetrahydrofolate reductase (NADPH)
MKISTYFSNPSARTDVSFEILPPLKGGSIQTIFNTLDPLMEFKPPFIDVTYHREEYIYKRKETGYYEKTSIRKRPGTVGICFGIMTKYGVEAVPHLICGGFTQEDTENVLIELNFLNIKNVLVLRGDASRFEGRFIPTEGGHSYAVDLVRQVSAMNKGIYLDENIENGVPTDFCIGVAGYPEKHFEAPNLMSDLKYAKMKVEAGAEYIVTQMFFDNKKYFDYVNACRQEGITVPIVPGLKPITRKYQINALPRLFHVDLPEALARELESAVDDDQVKEIGIQWCIAQSQELKKAGVPLLHYYTMGDAKTIHRIVSNVL